MFLHKSISSQCIVSACLFSHCRNSLSEALQVVHDYRDNAAPNGYYLKILLNELVKEERPQEEVGVVLQALHQRPTLTSVDIADIEQTVYLNNQRMDKAREVMEVS